MRSRTGHRWSTLGLASLALLGCKTDPDQPDPDAPVAEMSLRRMADCDDLSMTIEDSVVELIAQSRYGYYGGRVYWENDGATDGGATPGSPTDYTTTNVQETGVDELDLVKTDGDYLYVAQDRGLQIVKSWPAADTELVAQLDLEGWAQGLFLVGDKLVVFSNVNDALTDVDGLPDKWFYGTRMSIVDVSDRAHPTIERSIDVAGYVADARLVDGKVYFVANQWMDVPSGTWELASRTDIGLPDYPAWDAPEADWNAALATARTVLRPYVHESLASLDLGAYLPQWRTDADQPFTSMYACSDIYVPAQETPLAMLAVGQLDPATGDLGSTGVMSQGWTVYASTRNLYVAQTSQWWWGWGGYDKSHIHKFALGGDAPTYLASGEVDGWLYDQFAMSEYNGDLRVVTTDLISWGPVMADGGGSTTDGGVAPAVDPTIASRVDAADAAEDTDVPPPPANNVFVLRDDTKGSLDVIGHVGGIAPNERVYAVRMLGDKGYVVTFRQTDPLFTLDLSDPTQPAVVGALLMPGYSAYLHPIDEDHLLAVGMSGLESGELTGLAINLFDVSDLAHPVLLDQHEISPGSGGSTWSYSEALWDHHAFTYGRDTLTIPAFTQSWDEGTQTWSGFSGAIAFHVSLTDGITENGRVDHQVLVDDSICLYDWWWGRDVGASDVGSYCDWDYGYWYAQVRRSVYVEDKLYTLSNYGVLVNELNDPSVQIAAVPFYPVSDL